MDAVYEASMREESIDRHRPDIQHLRREIKQALTGQRVMGGCLLGSTLVYLFMTVINWWLLDIKDLESVKQSHWKTLYVMDLYSYT